MKRLVAAIRTDFVVQIRNNLYAIGIIVALIIAVGMWWLATIEQISLITPTLTLIVVGGSTLFYVAAMILFERSEGTLSAVIVSPLRTSEYLGSKIVTLAFLATLESAIMIGLALWLKGGFSAFSTISLPALALGLVCMGVIYTLAGIILVVRFHKIVDALIPLAAIAILFQIPAFHDLGLVTHFTLLAIPTSGPTEIIRGAFSGLQNWEWVYALGYSSISIGLGIWWAKRAFEKHVVSNAG